MTSYGTVVLKKERSISKPTVAEGASEVTPNADDEAVQFRRHAATRSLPLAPGVAVERDAAGHQKSAKPKAQPRGDRDFRAARRRGARSRIRRRSGNRHWIAPFVPLMHPASTNLVRVQLKAEKAGQPPDYRLVSFSVNRSQTALEYDADGSILTLPSASGASPSRTLSYDAEGQLASVSTNGTVIVESWYDAAGRRIAKREGGVLTLYVWDGMEILATADASGAIKEYYSRGPGIAGDVGSLLAETRINGGTNSTVFLHNNHRGDVVLASDNAGAVVGRYGYSAFGIPLSATGSYVPRFGFSSKERDASGLIYYGFRFHSPDLCRWITPDPIREDGGLNLYGFCGNDPVNSIDPDGFWGVSFGDTMIGSGDPWLEFDNDSWGDMGRGLAAGVDGMIPLVDPFENIYADDCGNVDDAYQTSRILGEASRDVLLSAFLLPQGMTRGATQVVTHWGPKGMNGLRSGDWVMTGGASLRNRIMAGARTGWKESITTQVPKESLHYPFGWQAVKGLWGQRIYRP